MSSAQTNSSAARKRASVSGDPLLSGSVLPAPGAHRRVVVPGVWLDVDSSLVSVGVSPKKDVQAEANAATAMATASLKGCRAPSRLISCSAHRRSSTGCLK